MAQAVMAMTLAIANVNRPARPAIVSGASIGATLPSASTKSGGAFGSTPRVRLPS